MTSPNVFTLVRQAPADAVTVRLTKAGADVLASVEWHRLGEPIEAGPTPDPMPVPHAINRAIGELQRNRLGRIVVMLDDGAEWRPEWGTLLPAENA